MKRFRYLLPLPLLTAVSGLLIFVSEPSFAATSTNFNVVPNQNISVSEVKVSTAATTGFPIEVATGEDHSCVLMANGEVFCWGENLLGQLGDGTFIQRLSPIRVEGIGSVKSISAGYKHSCAVMAADNTVKCWGWNLLGQLGDGSTETSASPVAVAGLTAVTKISLGYNNSCALLTSGFVKCWGSNYAGQLGDGTTENSSVPVSVVGLSGVIDIASGNGHSCAALNDGTVKCWGANAYGNLGNGTKTMSASPVDVSGLTSVIGLSVNEYHSCALLSDTTTKCWGDNHFGQLGDGSTMQRLTPVSVTGLSGVRNITTGNTHTCASLQSGEARCWGNNQLGRLGNNSLAQSNLPVKVVALTSVSDIAAGFAHTCSVDGVVKCWGNNRSGQMGDGTTTDNLTAVATSKVPQTLAWDQNLSGSVGGTITLNAMASSGLAVSYTSGTLSVCTVSGSTLSLIGAGSCTVTASQAGNESYNAATNIKTFNITGVTLSLSSTSVAFTSQPIDTTSSSSVVTITNTGTASLSVTGVTVIGTDASSFTPTNGCTTVAPSGTCSVSVVFNPTTTGAKAASLSIASNAAGSPATVSLSGSGVSAAPIINLTPVSFTFGDQLVGATSATQTLAIKNIGSATLTISSLVIGGANATSFIRSGSCTSVAVNATCSITISFQPANAGSLSATLTINSNAYLSAATVVPLAGTGVVTAISQLAGTSDGPGFVNGTGTAARFNGPTGIAIDASGNLFVADNDNHVIRRITIGAVVSTFAGTPLQPGAVNATGTSARFSKPFGIAINGTTLTVADTSNQLIRRVTSAGAVTTLAGTAGSVGSTNGKGSAARFSSPQGVVIDSGGNAFVADTGNRTIRRITSTGVTTTFAGTAGSAGSTNGTGSAARFQSPVSMTRDSSNNLYVADPVAQTLRRITTSGVVTTFAGTNGSSGASNGSGVAASFSSPSGAVVDSSGNIFIADADNGTVRKVTSAGVVTTFAGTAGSQGSANGTGPAAMFYRPVGIARDATNNVFVADPVAHTIRRITPAGVVTTFAGFSAVVGANDNTGSLAGFRNPSGIVSDANGNLYVADTGNHTIRKVTPGGVVTIFAGTAISAGTANGTGAAARFRGPTGLAIDSGGNIYVADTGNHTIRKITAAGVVTTVAGTAGSAGTTNGTGAVARFRSPSAVAVTTSGLLYVADTGNYTIRRITLSTGQVAALAGSAGLSGTTNGTGTAARFGLVYGLGVDSAGNVFASDYSASTIRRITAAGVVTTFSGTANSRGTTNGNGSAARFSSPYGLTVDAGNNIYVADYGNCLLRKITSAAAVTTAVGTAGTCRFNAGNAPGTINMPLGISKQGTTLHFVAGNGVGRVVNVP